VNADGAAGLVFYDKSGKQVAVAPVVNQKPSKPARK
jgi:hypothetical protein